MPMEMPRRPGASIVKRSVRFGVYLLAAVSQIAAADAQTYIAGTAPDRRPENAPKIETFEKSPQWLESATTGVTKPHYRRYVCPVCGMIARTTKDAHLICGDCLAPMTEN